MYWAYLVVAIGFEISFTAGAKVAQGFTRFWPSVFTVASATGTIYFLSLAMIRIDVAVGYAIMTGAGAIGAIGIGAIRYGEPITASRMACFACIVLGIVGLRAWAGGR
ncbi:DMT family transporter [Amycolatopsis sp. NPDC059090]|uniref:DMT family transporter n=1 Tax=unclassified Amycolatopsis TaxID=2618356 RepID=UPI003672884C